jgi:hypothetical protein
LIFKLHPNERHERATSEIKAIYPEALVFAKGSAEEMIANCELLICEHSSVVYVALALGKEVYTEGDLDELMRLLPVQNKRAAQNIADVCREMLEVDLIHTGRQEQPFVATAA